jgi:hypothetical protein
MTRTQQQTEFSAQSALVFDGETSRQYVFAYGSDMHPGQIRERCSNPVLVGVVYLPDHALGFFGHSEIWDGAVETVVSAPGRNLWGVVYELTFMDAQRLDAWHGARLDGAGSYFHFPVRVLDAAGKGRTVLLYKKDVLGEPLPPSREYLDFIIQGALERGLPQQYADELKQTESRPAGYPVPVRSKFQREIQVVTSCSECGS